MNKQQLLIILGPTASGKSSLGIELAKEFDGEIISADSRTIFREMNIGTAKPERDAQVEVEEMEEPKKLSIMALFSSKPYIVEEIPHHGFDLVNPDEDFTAADFKAFAEKTISDIAARGKLPIVVGGTGLYISALIDNLEFTDAPPNEEWRKAQEDISTVKLYERLQKFDREGAEEIDSQNRRRVLRALEIVETTGKKLSDQQTKGENKYDSLMIGVDRPREELYERIELRVDEMIAHGLVDEVRTLRAKYGADVNAMTGIGYRQIGQFLDGYLKLKDAIDLIKRDTRRYAKRQLTWFRRDDRIMWLRFDEAKERVRNWVRG